ncbi:MULTISPECIES: hypothetical protein [unclassified Rahnella]|uniref:hypothetical protein n=1 Tax=unclassified Rahnella TaxID=2635087 RepID=UPI001021E3DB|nr:hypothetical protein [Rahnella sp. CFA14(1/10)]
MRFVPVWIYLHSMSLGAAINYKIFLFYSRIIKVGLSLYKLLPLEIIFGMLHVMRFLRCIGKHQKALTLVANENKRCLLNDTGIVDFTWIAQRRKALDYAATYGKNQRVVSQLENCAYQLDQFVKPLHQSRKPVILAPLHMVSDILAGIVASKTYPGKSTLMNLSGGLDIPDSGEICIAGIDTTRASHEHLAALRSIQEINKNRKT